MTVECNYQNVNMSLEVKNKHHTTFDKEHTDCMIRSHVKPHMRTSTYNRALHQVSTDSPKFDNGRPYHPTQCRVSPDEFFADLSVCIRLHDDKKTHTSHLGRER